MKRCLFTAACVLILGLKLMGAGQLNGTSKMNHEPNKIVVISDIHLLAPELHDNGPAAQRLAHTDMKLVLHSDTIMQAIVDRLVEQRPALLLIAGDLTLDGARASHQRMATHLARLRQAGVESLVIPGNHDINNPNSRQYRGEMPAPATSVSSQEFAQIYADCGYGVSSRRDPNSLSYACEPLPGLVLLGIDSNRYGESQLGGNANSGVYYTDGRIKPETLQWLCQQACEARAAGKRVVAMMHHHLLEHIDGEARLLSKYIVADHEQVAHTLAQAGVNVVFTGHLHITDAVTDGAMTDVATGSASTFPMPMRVATLSSDADSLLIETEFLQTLPEQMLQQAQAQVERSAPTLARLIAERMWPRLSGQLHQMSAMLGQDSIQLPQNAWQATQLMMSHISEPLTRSLIAVTRGGEDPKQADAIIDAVRQGVLDMVAEAMPSQAEYMGPFLAENLFPRLEPMMRSALEDRNRVGTPQESATPDHRLAIAL